MIDYEKLCLDYTKSLNEARRLGARLNSLREEKRIIEGRYDEKVRKVYEEYLESVKTRNSEMEKRESEINDFAAGYNAEINKANELFIVLSTHVLCQK